MIMASVKRHKKIVEPFLFLLKVFHDLHIQISKAHDSLVSVYRFTMDMLTCGTLSNQ